MKTITENQANIKLYNHPDMVAAYSGTRLMPQEKKIFKNIKPSYILDLGCGTGRATAALQKMGHTVIGLDISEAMIKEARKLYPNYTFLLGDASNLIDFKEGEFDVVLFTCGGLDLLHPLSMRLQCLDEVIRVLKEQGCFIYSCHNKTWVDKTPEKNIPIGGDYYQNKGPVGLEVVYASNINEQTKQLQTVGLRIKKCYTGGILNYYVADKTEFGEKIQIIKQPSAFFSIPRRAYRKLRRILYPQKRETIVIDLTQPLDVLYGNIKKTRRHEIKCGLEDLNVIIDPKNKTEYLNFEANNAEKLGLFQLPPKWLDDCHIFIGKKSNQVKAAMLTHIRNNVLVLRRDSSNGDSTVHAALTWYVIQWAKEHGFTEFDHGGYNQTKHPGVSFWKSRFGGVLVQRKVP